MKLTKSQLKRIIKEELNKHQAEILDEWTMKSAEDIKQTQR
tara:strand:+ start:510 stop:632 length:123 start_codon:yes stop_codon:yes gene_type:complete